MNCHGEWTEVRRRKGNDKVNRTFPLLFLDSTSFYVSNLQKMLDEESCGKYMPKFGNVFDVYFGRRKDVQGNFYAFIRFKGVTDAMELEMELQGIMCMNSILSVNISKHPRKLPSTPGPTTNSFQSKAPTSFPPQHNRANLTKVVFERITWIKVIGLPREYWDEESFSFVASRFRKVISSFDDILHRSNNFVSKVGIITSSSLWINGEVSVVDGGRTFQVGVMEYADDWSPFCTGAVKFSVWDSVKTKNVSNKLDGVTDNDDVITSTSCGEDDDESEPEDEEFRPNTDVLNVDDELNDDDEPKDTTTYPRVVSVGSPVVVPELHADVEETELANTDLPMGGKGIEKPIIDSLILGTQIFG
ncbi:unnamed protein product [Lactuca virosa]|uniref:RRM domain-containing protein n=1 Tax=Lactuca virosa TaxID=75947 RepID=A0AAU9PMQ8_9ASTR|nr:unnamed protein product [Lactuca virosa]